MKRIITLLLILCIAMTSTVMAQNRPNKEERQIKEAIFKAATQVEANRVAIKTLNDSVRDKTKQMKDTIKILLDNKKDLSKDQITALKDSLLQIKTHQDNLKATLGDVNGYFEGIKTARMNKDFNQILLLYNNILAVQSLRLTELNQYNEILDQLLSII